ncbi:MAG TPA: alpha/beta hydrolase [Ktedonobacteraceae bacterium]|nr:alpha/beta hydrolase [Ktedonobacteraceae bacterium]
MSVNPVRDQFVNAGEIRLHCIQWGDHGTPLVCVHGLTANAFCFQALADELASEHRVFAYDLRGRGDSDQPEHGYSVPIHADDLAKLIDALGLERPILIGHSLGALISLYFATHYPNKLSKLVLIDAGAPIPWKTPEEQPAWLTASISRLGTPVPSFEEYTQRLKAAPFLGPYWNEHIDIYFQHDVRRQSDGSVVSRCYREGILEEGTRYAEAKPAEQWAHVQAPTLILRAGQGLFFDNDQLMTEEAAAAVQQGIKGSHLVNFPTLNHYTIIFGVEPGPFKIIRAFIKNQVQ